MNLNQIQVQEFKNYFSGSQHNFGEFTYNFNKINSKKKTEGVGKTATNQLITIKNYQNHLEGIKGLGVIPLDENNKSSFFVMDIDLYDVDYTLYIQGIERGNFPLVPFRSKSGGLHLYLFFKSPESNVQKVIEFMQKLAFLLSIDSLVKEKKKSRLEIFPKQTFLNKKENAVGNWINLPYYNVQNTQQYAIQNDKALSLNEALSLIKEKRTTLENLEKFIDELNFNDAPPCLQKIYILNSLNEDSGRNNFLFSFGVYLKKKNEDLFEFNLKEVNETLNFPLPVKEIETTILNSLRKKDYIYKCKEDPCLSFCHRGICKQREFGIGKDEGYFSSVEFGQLYQYKTKPPYYEWNIRPQSADPWSKVRFKSEDEIIKQDAVLRLCMRELRVVPSKLKQFEWLKILNQFLKEMKIVEVSDEDDTSAFVLFKIYLLEFLTGRIMAQKKSHIAMGRAYFESENEIYYFRIKDFIRFLYNDKQFRFMSPQDTHGALRELKGFSKTIRTEDNKHMRIACLYKKTLDQLADDKFIDPVFSNEEQF